MLQISVNDNHTFPIEEKDGKLEINTTVADWDVSWQANGMISVLYNGKSYRAIVESTDFKNKEISLRVNGQLYKATIKEPLDILLGNMGLDMRATQKEEYVKAPMPGMVLKILVQPGQHVNKGDGLILLEAMKMENILKASHDATVKAVRVTEKSAVEKGAILLELE